MSDRRADDRDTDFGDPDAFYDRYYQQVLRTGVVGSAQDRTHRALERRQGDESSSCVNGSSMFSVISFQKCTSVMTNRWRLTRVGYFTDI